MLIAVDMDEVLFSSLEKEIEWHNATYGTSLVRTDFKSGKYMDAWGCSWEESVRRIIEYTKSKYFIQIRPRKGAIKGINYLHQKSDLVIITSRSEELEKETVKSVDKYFPGKFKEIYFTNSFSSIGKNPLKKSKVCIDINVHTMIDDNLKHALDCADNHINALLFDHVWNEDFDVSSIADMERAYGWLGNSKGKGVIHLF